DLDVVPPDLDLVSPGAQMLCAVAAMVIHGVMVHPVVGTVAAGAGVIAARSGTAAGMTAPRAAVAASRMTAATIVTAAAGPVLGKCSSSETGNGQRRRDSQCERESGDEQPCFGVVDQSHLLSFRDGPEEQDWTPASSFRRLESNACADV